jgi:type VI secretion system protein ImpL
VQLSDFGAVFGYDGLFDKFFNDHLAKQIDTSGATWTWRPGSVNPSQRLLEQFQAAQRIRNMFFTPGGKTPSVSFFVSFSDVDNTASRFILQVDGQYMDNLNGKQTVAWPGPKPGNAGTSWDSRYFDPTKSYGGPWAWFHLIDENRVATAPNAQQSVLLNIQNRYHRARVTVEPSTAAASPFASWDWRQFSCQS